MVKKKSVKRVKKVIAKSKKATSSKRSGKTQAKSFISLENNSYERKISLVLKDLTWSVGLFFLFLILYNILSNTFLSNLLWMAALLTGVVSLAFLIAWLIFVILKIMKK